MNCRVEWLQISCHCYCCFCLCRACVFSSSLRFHFQLFHFCKANIFNLSLFFIGDKVKQTVKKSEKRRRGNDILNLIFLFSLFSFVPFSSLIFSVHFLSFSSTFAHFSSSLGLLRVNFFVPLFRRRLCFFESS